MRVPTAVALVSLALAAGACTEKKESQPSAPSGGVTSTQTAAGGGTGGSSAPILFGHVGSLSGSEATFGQSTDRGIKLALEEWNAKGGVKGRKIELRTLDNQGKPEESAVAATRLVAQDKVTVLLGEVASSRSLAMAPIADRYQVPMITPSSTNPKVTKDAGKTRPTSSASASSTPSRAR